MNGTMTEARSTTSAFEDDTRVPGLLIPFLDVGLAQNVMFSAAPPSWARFAPGYGAVRVLVDGAFAADFDETRGLLLALAWFGAITVAALLVFHRLARPRVG